MPPMHRIFIRGIFRGAASQSSVGQQKAAEDYVRMGLYSYSLSQQLYTVCILKGDKQYTK